MADVQVSGGGAPQPPTVVETSGGSSAAWAIVVIVLLAIVAWFVFGRGMLNRDSGGDVNINAKVETSQPSTPTPPPAKTP